MEIPIQVAVRIFPSPNANACTTSAVKNDPNGNVSASPCEDEQRKFAENAEGTGCCVQTIPVTAAVQGFMSTDVQNNVDNGIAGGLVQVGSQSYTITHALPADCTQNQVYHQTVFPLISLFMEGFDASVVTYGQQGTGKTYTLYGPGFDCVYGESDQGVVQRCVREIYALMANHPERTYAVNIGWVEICGEVIRDLLGVGNVHCANLTDVFQWLQMGMNNKVNNGQETNNFTQILTHTLFTFTLEQQWVTKEGLIQHRLSTASFSDLCATRRLFMLSSLDQPPSLPNDLGLQALEHVVNTLTDPALLYSANGNIPYNQTTLTTLLKDSFGGRAQTLVILCVSPYDRDMSETICNLKFALKVQCVRNYVIMNRFSDDNTPISPEVVPEMPNVTGMGGLPSIVDNFGLQFAASQWFKLVSNAEGLFAKLISSNNISDLDKEQIEEWLFLKQECEECLSSSEAILARSQKHLGPIQEAEEPEETVSEPETTCQQNSDNDSDSESQRPDLDEKLQSLMKDFSLKTDSLVKEKYNDFIEKQPNAVMNSLDNIRDRDRERREDITENQVVEKLDERKGSTGRRRSLQPGASLSSAEIAMLNRVASREQTTASDDFFNSCDDLKHAKQIRAAINSPIENIQRKIRKLDTDIEARQRQIKEIEKTMQIKQNIITELVKNSETRTKAKQRVNKKKSKLEADYEKSKKQLTKAIAQGKEENEIARLTASIQHIQQRLQDLSSMKHIAGECGQKVKRLHQSLQEYKKLIDDLQKQIKKEKKARDLLDIELRTLKEKQSNKAVVKVDVGGLEERGRNLKEVQARISHLDHVLREKSENLEQYDETEMEQKEGLRHEIRNLRHTRDHLLDQRCTLDRKLKRDKILSHREERKLLECDEAIEAIDAAIEFKNELICGHKSIDTSERIQREKGEQMLMARLNKLSTEEMRTLLYKYFTKVIDLRDSSRKLEVQLIQLERERDAWEWKERVLSNAVRQARLEGERNAVLLQRQHEMKLTLMLRHLAEETTSASSASYGEPPHYIRPNNLALPTHATNSTNSSQYTDCDFEMDFYKNTATATAQTNKMIKAHKHGDLEICPLPDALTKYKPLDKLKEKERESKNKLFPKFQVLMRYAGQSVSVAQNNNDTHQYQQQQPHGAASGHGSNRKKEKEAIAAIPQENLKRLISAPSATKVTRQKNKIIIQDATRKN
ncbi:kinesin-like protein costa isoform X2 [Teleopsis dalmanni]|uniref:kinesin-like protein costa isoform X2 n=1 Tax=Teleopsis dalmanni TaxID=139649 RepID=UPI0018CFBE1E|nr:kinesin-like protein costa isoform X2 [Teleopsis dalmanni]